MWIDVSSPPGIVLASIIHKHSYTLWISHLAHCIVRMLLLIVLVRSVSLINFWKLGDGGMTPRDDMCCSQTLELSSSPRTSHVDFGTVPSFPSGKLFVSQPCHALTKLSTSINCTSQSPVDGNHLLGYDLVKLV